MCKKLGSAIGMFKYVSKLLPRHIKILMYNSFILPYFNYCATVWFQTSKCNLDKLQVLQNRALRFILNCSFDTHVVTMFKKLKLLNVRQLCIYNLVILMFKIENNIVPNYLTMPETKYRSRYNLRSYAHNNLYHTNKHVKSLYVTGRSYWNRLPVYIKTCNNITVFKRCVKKFIFDTMD